MGMGIPWDSHGNCPMGWDGMGQHELNFPWDHHGTVAKHFHSKIF